MSAITPDQSDQFSTFNKSFTSAYRFEETPMPMKAVKRTCNELSDYVYTNNGTLKPVNLDEDEGSIWESGMVGGLMKLAAIGMALALLALSVGAALGYL